MVNNKIFVSDLDGTLLNNDGHLSNYSKKVLNDLLDQGLLFTVASARSVHTIREVMKGVRLSLPVISLNGGYISDINKNEHLLVNDIDVKVKSKILSIINEYDLGVFISISENNEEKLLNNQILNEGQQWYWDNRDNSNDPRLRKLEDINSLVKQKIMCFTFIDKRENLIELEKECNKLFEGQVEIHLFENQYSKDWYWLTVHDAKATKANAIKAIKVMNPKFDEVTVFGDQVNDIKMFELADNSIAVENACAQLKDHATQIIGKNTEDSVANYLIKTFLKTNKL